MTISWTVTQLGRLKELDAGEEDLTRGFETEKERDRAFQLMEKNLVGSARQKLEQLRTGNRRPRLSLLESR
ncbi:MAG: hypothetical protein P8X85_17945, partial [Desulfobacterales bacterium]